MADQSQHPGTTTKPASARPTYELVLRPEVGVDGPAALQVALKRLLRTHGLRCIRVRELPEPERGKTTT